MAVENSQSESKDNSKLLALLLLIGAGVLGLLYLSSEDGKKTVSEISAKVRSEKYEKSVNSHLMVTNENLNMQRQRMEIENAKLAQDFNATKPQQAYQPQQGGVDLSSDSKAADIANELGRGTRQETFENPNDVIQKELFNKQQEEEYTRAYKEEYARQFVENAKRGGYDVRLDENYKVISVRPIRGQGQPIGDGMSDALQ